MIKTLIPFPLSDSWECPSCGRNRSFLCPSSSPSSPHPITAGQQQWLWRVTSLGSAELPSWLQGSFFNSAHSCPCHWMFSSQTHSVPPHPNLPVSVALGLITGWVGHPGLVKGAMRWALRSFQPKQLWDFLISVKSNIKTSCVCVREAMVPCFN